MSGVGVAGIDAGKCFNTWPLMNGDIIPVGYWKKELGLNNLFENMATTQMNHRCFGYATYTLASFIFFKFRVMGMGSGLGLGLPGIS